MIADNNDNNSIIGSKNVSYAVIQITKCIFRCLHLQHNIPAPPSMAAGRAKWKQRVLWRQLFVTVVLLFVENSCTYHFLTLPLADK